MLSGPSRVVPDAHGLLELAHPRVRLLADVEDGVVSELHREVVPHARHRGRAGVDAGRLGLAHRANAPGAVTRSPPALGRDREALAGHRERAAPAAGLREARGVEEHAPVTADEVTRLGPGRDRARPAEVERDAVLRRLQHEAQAPQGLEHFDAKWPDAVLAAVGELARGAHHAMERTAPHHREGVLRPEVRVLPHAHHQEQLVARGVAVEVVAVVEVAIAGRDEPHRLGGLMDREVVPGRDHARLRARRAG